MTFQKKPILHLVSINKIKGRTLFFILFVLLALLHLVMAVFNHYQFRTFPYYYGVYNFAYYDFAHLHSSPNPVLFDIYGATFMQDHFSLLLPLLSPLYWIFTPLAGTYTLILFQWVFVIYGAWATLRLVDLKARETYLPPLAACCYLFLFSRFASAVADCNLAIMGSALVPVFLYYFEKGKKLAFYSVFALLLIIREDFSLWLVFICLYLIVENRHDKLKRKLALYLALAAGVFFMVVMTIIIPALEIPNVRFLLFNYSALGEDTISAMGFIIKHPLETLKLLFVNHLDDPAFDGLKLKYYIVFACSGSILLFWRPAMLLCFIPLAAKKMFNDDPVRWDIESYYGIETASILPVLLFLIIAELYQRRSRLILSALVATGTLCTTFYCLSTSTNWHAPLKMRFYEAQYWQQNIPLKDYYKALEIVPDDVSLSASGKFVPHLAYRKKIYLFPVVKDAEYICANIEGEGWPLPAEEYKKELEGFVKNKDWQVIYNANNLVILKRTGEVDPNTRKSVF